MIRPSGRLGLEPVFICYFTDGQVSDVLVVVTQLLYTFNHSEAQTCDVNRDTGPVL